jgi:two-component system, sensor histidine kinase YcbA
MTSHRLRIILPYVLMIFLVPLAGEFQFYSLSEDFRISFATPTFLLILLYFKKVNSSWAGVIVGLAVVITRVSLDVIGNSPFLESLHFHLPVITYYITYGLLFSFLKPERYTSKPIYIGLYAITLEIMASTIELSTRYLTHVIDLSFSVVTTIILVAIIRSFFVMGFYMLTLYNRLQLKESVQRKKNDQMHLIISNLYVELFQLKKTIETSEMSSTQCYYLSKRLQDYDRDLGKELLQLSGQMHECKKDNQRIYAGLSNIIEKQELNRPLSLEEIIQLVTRINHSYATYLKKDISFVTSMENDSIRFEPFYFISILNNLITNSVEAIESTGKIEVKVQYRLRDNYVKIYIFDDGPGIEKKNQPVIFTPGFTTKYNESGTPSNGIGLHYIKHTLEKKGGSIDLCESIPNIQTTFLVSIPTSFNL